MHGEAPTTVAAQNPQANHNNTDMPNWSSRKTPSKMSALAIRLHPTQTIPLRYLRSQTTPSRRRDQTVSIPFLMIKIRLLLPLLLPTNPRSNSTVRLAILLGMVEPIRLLLPQPQIIIINRPLVGATILRPFLRLQVAKVKVQLRLVRTRQKAPGLHPHRLR